MGWGCNLPCMKQNDKGSRQQQRVGIRSLPEAPRRATPHPAAADGCSARQMRLVLFLSSHSAQYPTPIPCWAERSRLAVSASWSNAFSRLRGPPQASGRAAMSSKAKKVRRDAPRRGGPPPPHQPPPRHRLGHPSHPCCPAPPYHSRRRRAQSRSLRGRSRRRWRSPRRRRRGKRMLARRCASAPPARRRTLRPTPATWTLPGCSACAPPSWRNCRRRRRRWRGSTTWQSTTTTE